MARIRMKRHTPAIDMTPMVDLGFLLVTFFMMTSVFQPQEPAPVSTPRATTREKMAESNNATIVVSKDNKVFFRMDGVVHLKALGEKLNTKYNLGLTEDEITKFSHQANYGLDLTGMKQFLNLSEVAQKAVVQTGIPYGADNNQLRDFIIDARIANPVVQMNVKGDKATNYPVIKRIIDTLQECNVNRFYLVTDTKETPST